MNSKRKLPLISPNFKVIKNNISQEKIIDFKFIIKKNMESFGAKNIIKSLMILNFKKKYKNISKKLKIDLSFIFYIYIYNFFFFN